MRFYSKIGLIILVLITDGIVHGQEAHIPDQPLEIYNLTMDRTLYIAGEEILFSFFCSTVSDEPKDPLSTVVYAELFNADQKVVTRGKFRIKNGFASGRLIIPDETPTGVYYLRAYTRYLRNFHPATFPLELCTVVNPDVPIQKIEDPSETTMLVFPSGGSLINGIPAKIAVLFPKNRTTAPDSVYVTGNDIPIETDVAILDQRFGLVSFIPRSNIRYSIKVYYSENDSIQTALPEVKPEGLASNIKESDTEAVYQVLRKTQNTPAGREKFILTVSSSLFSTCYVDSTNTNDTVFDFHVPKDLLEPGLNFFTLHTSNNQLYEVRPYFLQPDIIEVSIEPDKSNYKTREEVSLKFSLPEDLEEATHLSVSTVKKGTLPNARPVSVIPPVFRPSIFQDGIVNPNSGIETTTLSLEIRNILLQQQLRAMKSIHEELMNSDRTLLHLPEYRDVSISGYVRKKSSKEPVAGTRVLLSYLGEGTHIQVNETQTDGSFVFSLYPYQEKQNLFLCSFEEGTETEILISNDFTPAFPPVHAIQPALDTTHKKLLKQLAVNKQLNTLIKSEQEQNNDGLPVPLLGFGTPDVSIRLEDYIDLPTMEVVLNEIVPYVKVRKRKGEYVLSILDPVTDLLYENHLIVVDDIPLSDINELMQLHPAQVEQVDVINRTYVIGDFTFRGILLVTTKTPNFGGISMPPGAVFIDYEMINKSDPFPQSLSFQPAIEGFDQPDFRNVLYWNPNLKLKDQTTLSFYTSDHRSVYELVVRGKTKEGKIVFGRTEIVVE